MHHTCTPSQSPQLPQEQQHHQHQRSHAPHLHSVSITSAPPGTATPSAPAQSCTTLALRLNHLSSPRNSNTISTSAVTHHTCTPSQSPQLPQEQQHHQHQRSH